MGDWSSATYIASQIITIVAFALIGATFFIKKRPVILALIIICNLVFITSFALLQAWVGVAMSVVAIGRDLTLLVIDKYKKPENKKRIMLVDWIFLAVLTAVMVTSTYFTAAGWMTWFGFAGTYCYCIAIWQKNILVYRILGVICEALWVVYNVVIQNLFGTILEGVLTIVIAVGLILYIIEIAKKKKAQSQIGRRKTSRSDTESPSIVE